MIDTAKFRTKTFFNDVNNEVCKKNVPSFFPVGIDIGYSSVKSMSPLSIGQFPSFAQKIDAESTTIGTVPEWHITYTDLETGARWKVGAAAENNVSNASTNESQEVLYLRNRYSSEMYLVLFRVGLGAVMRTNGIGSVGDRTLKVQTGLPPAFVRKNRQRTHLKDIRCLL